MTDPKYVPPLAKGTRVRLLVDYSGMTAGALGTITWTHPFPPTPYRVKWDDAPPPGRIIFGMDHIGWLMKPHEIEEVTNG